jgi:hypothetical protein
MGKDGKNSLRHLFEKQSVTLSTTSLNFRPVSHMLRPSKPPNGNTRPAGASRAAARFTLVLCLGRGKAGLLAALWKGYTRSNFDTGGWAVAFREGTLSLELVLEDVGLTAMEFQGQGTYHMPFTASSSVVRHESHIAGVSLI